MSGQPMEIRVFLPPGYPSTESMRFHSPRIIEAVEARGYRLTAQKWNGDVVLLPTDSPSLVHFTFRFHQPNLGAFIAACDRGRHLGFCSDKTINGKERDPVKAVNLWLDQNFPQTAQKGVS